jgi:Domain of unknown function (DUF5615)
LRFYLDENVPEGLIGALGTFGHDVESTSGLARKRTPDHLQLLFAAQSLRILVSYDADDFRSLHLAWRDWSAAWQTPSDVARHPGILVIQQDKSGLDVPGIARVIDELVSSLANSDEAVNRLWIWKRATGWREVL